MSAIKSSHQEHTQQRQSVKQEYEDKLAQESGFCAHQFETDFGYSEEQLASVPETASGSSFGCANPLAMGTIQPGDTVIDLGSGSGMDVILAAQRVGDRGKVVGVDMTGAMVEKARKNITQAGVEKIAEIRQGIIESLPLESNSADWVISNCVISLSPDKKQVFSEVFRVLKPGGKMLLADLVMAPAPVWLRLLMALKSPASAKALDKERYLQTISQAGLSRVQVRNQLDYDSAMLQALALDELNLHTSLAQALLKLDINQLINHAIKPFIRPSSHLMNNKISSIKVYAEKPATNQILSKGSQEKSNNRALATE